MRSRGTEGQGVGHIRPSIPRYVLFSHRFFVFLFLSFDRDFVDRRPTPVRPDRHRVRLEFRDRRFVR